MFTNTNGLHGNRDELAIAATKFDVACAKTKVTGRRHVSELFLPGFKAPTLLLRGARPNGLGMALFVRSGRSVSRPERFERSCWEFMVAKIPGRTRPKENRLCVRVLQAPPPHVSNVPCVFAMLVPLITHCFILNSNAI